MTGPAERYDRQLLLWEGWGQQWLERSRVACVGAGLLASEALRGLVLPGVGSVTVVAPDDARCSEPGDFLRRPGGGSLGDLLEGLRLLNPAVDVRACPGPPLRELLAGAPSAGFWGAFDAVLLLGAEWLPPSALPPLRSLLHRLRVPLLSASACGLLGAVHLCLRAHCVLRSRPDSPPLALSFPSPCWPQLSAFLGSLPALSALSPSDFASLPSLILLHKAWQAFRLSSSIHSSSTHSPSSSHMPPLDIWFEPFLPPWARQSPPPNALEARRTAARAWSCAASPPQLEQLLEEEDPDLAAPSSLCHDLLAALGRFVRQHGRAPVCPLLSDMESATGPFLALQRLFSQQADRDLALLEALFLLQPGRSLPLPPFEALLLRTIASHCHEQSSSSTSSSSSDLTLRQSVLLKWQQLGRTDLCLDEPLLSRGLATEPPLPSVAALIGGVVAAEALKLLTHQWLPLDGILFYDGLTGTIHTFASDGL